MIKLSNFILHEALKTRSVIMLHKYDTIFKHQIIKDLEEQLFKSWISSLTQTKSLGISKQNQEDLLLRDSKSRVKISVSNSPTKLYSSTENGRTKLVSPVVFLPLCISENNRMLAKKIFFDSTIKVFNQLIDDWNEAFIHITSSGNMITDFKVKQDARSVSLTLNFTENNVHHSLSIFHVNIENGKIGSKIRNYDLIYLSIDR